MRLLIAIVALSSTVWAQDRLRSMPGYDQYQQVSRQIQGSVISGAITPAWTDGGAAFEYVLDGQRYRHEIASGLRTPLGRAEPPRPGAPADAARPTGTLRGQRPGAVLAPGGRFQAFAQNRNLWLADGDGINPIAVTTDGGQDARIHYASSPWVYAEELLQTTSIWWSPSGTKVAAYRFDQRAVPD